MSTGASCLLGRIAGALALALALGPAARGAALDSLHLDLVGQFGLPVRWDNIEGPQELVTGPRPGRIEGTSLRGVRLSPGQDVLVHLAPASALGIVDPRAPLTPGDVAVEISNGSGLFVRQAAGRAPDGRMLVVEPESLEATLARVSLPTAARADRTLALLVSRAEPLFEIAPARDVVSIPAPLASLRRSDEAAPTLYHRVRPEDAHAFRLRGPARLAIETRLVYPLRESQGRQTYRLLLDLRGDRDRRPRGPTLIVEFQTGPETAFEVAVDRRVESLGREQVGYLDVPPGEHLARLGVTAPVFVRVLRLRDPDYLIPRQNEPRVSARDLLARPRPAGSGLDAWAFPDRDRARIQRAGPRSTEETERLALRLARNNDEREGGLMGAMLMREEARRRPDDPRVRRVAGEILAAHTVHRDLLPMSKPAGRDLALAHFVSPRLLPPGQTPRDVVLARGLVEDSLGGIESGLFVELSSPGRLVYHPPPRIAPSLLRVAIASPEDAQLLLRLDGGATILLRVRRRHVAASVRLGTSVPLAALAAWSFMLGDRPGGSPLGPLGILDPPAPLLEVATAEIALPQSVREVSVERNGGGPGGVLLALAYRTGRPFGLGQTQYLEMVRRLGSRGRHTQLLVAALRGRPRTPDLPSRELVNHWAGLSRLVEQECRRFASAVAPPVGRPAPRAALPGIDAAATWTEAARGAQAQGQWLASLEAWSQVLATGPPAGGGVAGPRGLALLGRIDALEKLGELGLLERQLRGLYLFDPDLGVRELARDRLAGLLARLRDRAGLLGLAATQARRAPTPRALRDLAVELARHGHDAMALAVGIAIERRHRPHETLLAAAFAMRWWTVFDDLLADVPRAQGPGVWRGLEAAANGRYEEAFRSLESGGRDGALLAAALEMGLDVRARLAASHAHERMRAILDWEAWLAAHPGARRWEAGPVAVDFHSGELVRHPGRDLTTRAYISAPDRPVRFALNGPVRVRIECRPLHPVGSASLIDDWLEVRWPGQRVLVPILNDRAVETLVLTGHPLLAPGAGANREIDLPLGRLELAVRAQKTLALVQMAVERPRIPLGVLPPLTPELIEAALEPGGPVTGGGPDSRHVLLVPGSGPQRPVLIPCEPLPARPAVRARHSPDSGRADGALHPGGEPSVTDGAPRAGRASPKGTGVQGAKLPGGYGAKPHVDSGDLGPDPLLAARLGLRRGLSGPGWAAGLEILLDCRRAVSPQERARAMVLLGRLEPEVAPALPGRSRGADSCLPRLPEPVVLAGLLERGRTEEALERPLPQDGDGLLDRLCILARLAQADPDERGRAQTLAEGIALTHPGIPGAGDLLGKLLLDRDWIPFLNVSGGAGLYREEAAATWPEGLALRARAALLPPPAPDWSLVHNTGALAVYLANSSPTTVRLDMAMADVEYSTPVPMTALIRLDDGAPARVSLTPRAPVATRTVAVPAGEHVLDVAIEKPVLGQFLLVRVGERRVRGPPVPRVETVERIHHFATATDPLVARLEGPAILRIDEQRGAQTFVHYRVVDEGFHTVRLAPTQGGAEALVRVFVRATSPAPIEPRPRHLPWTVPVVGPPAAVFSTPRHPPPITRHAPLPLGGQEDGTWSAGVAAVRRRLVDEERADSPDAEGFREVLASYRFFDEPRRTHRETSLLLRERDAAGATVGLRGQASLKPQDIPLTFHVETEGFVQTPGDANGQTLLAALVRGGVRQRQVLDPRTTNEPAASAFFRTMTAGAAGRLGARQVDQDVFTRHKDIHRSGLVLSDTLSYRPWLDTTFSGSAAVASNAIESLPSIDHLRLRTGLSVLFGDTLAQVAYHLTRFLADEDRSRGATTRWVALALASDWPRPAMRRLEVGLALAHDLDSGETSGEARATWHLGLGRGDRDFHPGQIAFSDLRRRRLYEAQPREGLP